MGIMTIRLSVCSYIFPRRFLSIGHPNYNIGKCKQCNSVWNDHQIVKHIRQLPHQRVGYQSTHEDEYQGNDGIDGDRLLSEQVDNIDLTKQIPTKHRGECEEEQADRHKHGASFCSKDDTEGRLCQVCVGQSGRGPQQHRTQPEGRPPYTGWR